MRKLYGYPLYLDLKMERMREKKTAMMARPMKAWTRFFPPASALVDDDEDDVECFFSAEGGRNNAGKAEEMRK